MSTAPPRLSADLLHSVEGVYCADVSATEPGIVAGLERLNTNKTAESGDWQVLIKEGERVAAGTALIRVRGTASELATAEDLVMGTLGYASGIATGAQAIRSAAPEGLSIACGGWKKLPLALKPLLRAGLAAAGVLPRLVEGDFIYVNKNAVKLLGGVGPAIAAGIALNHGPVAIQVGTTEEALFAAREGAGIIMVDTADLDDLAAVHQALEQQQLRDSITLAFGGGVKLEDLGPAYDCGAQTVDVGRAILNSPLLDLRMQVRQ